MAPTGNWDGRISRRTLLRAGGSATAAYVLLGRSARSAAAPPSASDPFALGVASGDPTPGGVVLWTRLAPDPMGGGGMPPEVVGVRFEVAADQDFREIVRRGAITAVPEEAHTVHAEIGGLQADTPYWYRFKWGLTESRVGRTRTAPEPGSAGSMRFAFASCQNYTNGFFGAYADLATRDVDLVVHLGDYIYEGPGLDPARVRDHVPQAELFTLNDYRLRHAQYRTDLDLQAAHAAFPWLMTWDDHEFKDNYADLDLDPDQPLEAVAARRAAAYLAYWEHAPLARARKPVGKDMPLFRRLRWGSLATFHVLDTRQYRSDQIAECAPAQRDPASGYCPDALQSTRGILGGAQRAWLFEGLAEPGAAWNVIANQVGFAPLDMNAALDQKVFSRDSWDGYVADRQRVLDFLAQQRPANTVVITGDAHKNSVRNVPPDFHSLDGDPVATEFIGTSISSGGDGVAAAPIVPGDANNPHVLFEDHHRGYVTVTLDPDLWSTEFRGVASVVTRTPVADPLAGFLVENGRPGAQRAAV